MRPPIVAAYYYPGYHPTPQRVTRTGDTEWELLFDDVAKSAYPDVRRPLGGPVHTSAASLEAETRAAQRWGIDAFLWCWYWDRGRLIFNEALDMLLSANLPAGFKYALMWVNKRPHFRLPIEEVPTQAESNARLVPTDEADFRAMVEHLVEHHFPRPSYIVVDNRPLLPIFVVEPLIRQLGANRLAKLLSLGDDVARAAGFAGVHYVAVMHRLNTGRQWLKHVGLGRWAGDAPLAEIGFRSVSTYLYLTDWDGPRLQHYPRRVDRCIADWPKFADRFGLPFWPSVSPGWDARVRGVPRAPEPNGHPWSPIVVDESPAQFARLLESWKSFARSAPHEIPLLPVTSWNEWTEGHAVAPCDRHGEGMVEALRAFKASFDQPR